MTTATRHLFRAVQALGREREFQVLRGLRLCERQDGERDAVELARMQHDFTDGWSVQTLVRPVID
jgi:hypothetical protein